MLITYDSEKNKRNVLLRSLSFDQVVKFDFETAMIAVDNRKDYGEVRYNALGYLDDRLHVLCFTMAKQEIKVISFRKANKREVIRYDNAQKAHTST